MPRIRLVALQFAAVLVVFLGFSATAFGASGWVKGFGKFTNANGNYCPTGANCTGARYTQAMFNQATGIPNARVTIYDDAASPHVVGAGKTAQNGSYLIKWTGVASRPNPAKITLVFQTALDDNIFFVGDTTGAVAKLNKPVTPVNGTTQAAPQNVTDALAGADGYWAAYWALEKQWRETLVPAGGMALAAAGTEVRGFADTISSFQGTCLTSCAWGPDRQVQLDSNAKFAPQARAMHEFGHIVSYQTHPWQLTGDYGWDGDNGWSQGSHEWGVAGWEEANATHYGSITFWQATAVQPTTCLTNGGHCYSGTTTKVPFADTDIEATSYPHSVNNCDVSAGTPEARKPISHMRFMWDVYDNHNDADSDDYSAAVSNYGVHLNVLASYPEGTDANQIDEPWDASRTMLTERDGRGSLSYNYNFGAASSHDVFLLMVDNCSPP